MPYTINFENEGCGVVLTFEGLVVGKELLEANQSLHVIDEQHKLRYQIWDFNKAKNHSTSEDHLRHIARQDNAVAEKNPNQKIVIIGTRHFILGTDTRYNIYAKIWSGFPIKTVSSMEEARQWVMKVLPKLFS